MTLADVPFGPLLRVFIAAVTLAGCTGTEVFRAPEDDASLDTGVDSDLDRSPDAGATDVLEDGQDGDDPATDGPADPPRDDDAEPTGDLDAGLPQDAADGDLANPRDGGDFDLGPYTPALYRGDRLRSPITAWVADALAAIAARGATRQPDVFMKVGASGTVSTHLLYCFAGESQPRYTLDLAGRDDLLATIAFFRGGDAAGDTPFDRPTEAALSGRSAVWAISGDPSPLETEIAAINPRYAFLNYGTNDMQLGATYESALWPFYRNFSQLLDETIDAGIIPIVTGLNPRDDSAQAARWVPAYNTVTRGIAEARQVPYINMYVATRDLPDMGLVSDGIHGNVYRLDGAAQPCVFTTSGLQFNYNVRNLLSIEALDQVRSVVFGGADPDRAEDVLRGRGSPSDPYVVDELPFTHYADTAASPHDDLDAYPACDSGQDESGPEYRYRLTLEASTSVRLMVFDGAGVDIDMHLLGESGTAASCLARHDRIIQRTLPAGTYTVVLDTFVPSDGLPRDGEYLFAVLACEPGDTACR